MGVMNNGTVQRDEPLANYSQNKVVGAFDALDAPAVAAALVARGFVDVQTFIGPPGAEELDFSGEHHGVLGRVNRTLHRLTEDQEMRRYQAELLAGNAVVTVFADDELSKKAALVIMESHGGRFIHHFGPAVVTKMTA